LAPIYHRTGNGTGCAMCANKIVVESNCLAHVNPQLAEEWHPFRNGNLTPHDVTTGTTKRVWWKCPKGTDHEWETSVVNRTNGSGCPVCVGQIVVNSNSLETINPRLAGQWHPEKNGELQPTDVTAFSGKRVWWRCEIDDEHEWITAISNRSAGKSCPYCTLTPQSRQELIIAFELKLIFPDINPRGFKAKIKGRLKSIDIFIPQLNLGIEFDGSYWHKDKRALDKLKTEKLNEAGFTIIRIREEPLKKLHEIDIISPKPYNGKFLANSVLARIQKLYFLEARVDEKINDYMDKIGLQNESELDSYVERILEEKAET
ncbi:zinc-ribbon domain-containing protein, partial [Flavobacteriales bacterium]|nr:zinc-ribbon domain-containing protein [Flavobacteriales bacterium]